MSPFLSEASSDTPRVVLNKEQNLFEFSGKSLPEDVNSFYDPIIQWLSEYFQDPNPETVIDFNLDYLNTASSKSLLSLFLVIEAAKNAGKNIRIIWRYFEDDEDMHDVGEEYSEIIKVPFELISYTD
jgi:hypothetical protein